MNIGRFAQSVMKSKFSKFIVSLVIILNTAFTSAVLYVFMKVGSEPTALVAAWFAFTTGELWFLANIKKAKEKRRIADEDRLETEADK